ncbi:tetratricopeptide repeat protein [Patescibacteria group bacterium]|nr:tetratricopeptide repeat protein [Patescibacteria group bacterium]MBU1682931.1 tetratricopeptide repeat protein [Patescibacteria group bacterium]MBU1935224.1 tetratricopeptide repeat protein [Patescibacteria group bacterium]
MSNQQQNDRDFPEHIADALNYIEELKLSGEHKKSIEEAEKLLCSDPDCVSALEEIADNYVSLDDFKRAEKACNRALNLNQKSYTANYILGFITSQKQDWPKAIDYLKKSNDLHSNNPEILRCLGWALFNNKKRTQGIVILERALNLDPENSLTLCDLGICYLQTKNFEKSVELLKQAMEIDPDNKRIQDCYMAAKGFKDRYTDMKSGKTVAK